MAPTAAARAQAVDPYSTESVYEMCQSTVDVVAAMCTSFVVATFAVMQSNGGARHGIALDDNDPPVPFDPAAEAFLSVTGVCPTTVTSAKAMVQAFKNWAAAHPESWSDPASGSVMSALAQTWPCTLSN